MSAASKLISFQEASEIAGGLHPNTFRQRKAGTHVITHVPIGRRVFMLREEFESWLEGRINQAKAEERKRRKNFQLITGQG